MGIEDKLDEDCAVEQFKAALSPRATRLYLELLKLTPYQIKIINAHFRASYECALNCYERNKMGES